MKVEKSKKDYHNACKAAKTAITQENNAKNSSDQSADQVIEVISLLIRQAVFDIRWRSLHDGCWCKWTRGPIYQKKFKKNSKFSMSFPYFILSLS